MKVVKAHLIFCFLIGTVSFLLITSRVNATWNSETDDDGDGYSEEAGDCDDTDSSVSPGADEVCDGIDNDCDNLIDANDDDVVGATTYYPDYDNDGYGDNEEATVSCSQPTGYITTGNDCDDEDSSAYPGATEICDGVDNDCNGEADGADAVDIITWYPDSDADDYGVNSDATIQSCDEPDGYADNSDDCDDASDDMNPDATEICLDSVDNDCDGTIDESDCKNASISSSESSAWINPVVTGCSLVQTK